MDAGLDAWLSKALDARDRGLPIPDTHSKRLVPKRVQHKGEQGSPLDDRPVLKRGRVVRTDSTRESLRKCQGRTALGRQQQTRRSKKLEDCPYEENPLRDFKQIPIKRGSPSLSPTEPFFVLTDDESLDEGEMYAADGRWRDACHPLETLCEDQILAREELHATLKERMPAGSKKDKTGKKDSKPEEAVKFTGISAGEQRRRLEYKMSERLSRRREAIPMATAVRQPVQEAAAGKETYEYRFLGYKLDLNDGLRGDAQVSSVVETKEQQCSPSTLAKRHREWLNNLEYETNVSAASPADLHRQDDTEEQPICSESTVGIFPQSHCDRRGEGRTLGSSASSDYSSPQYFQVHSLSGDASRLSPHTDTENSSSPLFNTERDDWSFPRDAFDDDDTFLDSPSSSSVPDCSEDQIGNGVPKWDALEKYSEIIDQEGWKHEEQPLGWDGEGALEQFQHECDKYKAKNSVDAPFWEELRRSVPSFGFDRAREDKYFVGYDEDGKEVRYTDERFMERRIRENQILEYQAKCRRLLEEQDRCDREQRRQDNQQEKDQKRAGIAEKRKQGREQIFYVGKRKSVWWKAGFHGMAVELKNLVMENDQIVCVVGRRASRRRGVKKSQSDVHNDILTLAKRLRLARDKQRSSEKQQLCGVRGDRVTRKEDGGLAHAGAECGIENDHECGSEPEKDVFGDLEHSVGDDSFQEDFEEWSVAESEEKSEAEDNETVKYSGFDKESGDGDKDDKEDDGLMPILRNVPEDEITRKAKKVNRSKNRDDRDWGQYLQEMEDKKRKKQQQEEERCRQVIFSHSLEFAKQEKERKREAKRARMLDELETMDREMRLLLEELEGRGSSDGE